MPIAMNSGVLFVITSDPRTNPRPAEAIRVAAGVGVWKKITVTIYLRGAAVLALSEVPDTLVDGDNFGRYLPLVTESGGVICAQRGAAELRRIGRASVRFHETGDDELAALAAKHQCVVHF